NYFFRSARTRGPLIALVFPVSILAGCVTSDQQGSTRSTSADVLAQVREIDLSARYPNRVSSADRSPAEGPQPQSYYGDGTSAMAAVKPKTANHSTEDSLTTGSLPMGAEGDPGNQGYELNFENTP